MLVEREISNLFSKIAEVYPIVAVVGPRQAGKTTFLKEQLKKNDGVYLLFDDPDIRNIFDEDIKKFERQYLSSGKVVVFDEVNYASSAGKNLKYLADTGSKIWITSSSELILGQSVLSHLVGRVSIMRLFPFNNVEFLRYKNIYTENTKILSRELEEHIIYGGYPKVVTTSDIELKNIILRDLYETLLLKDIAYSFSIDDIASLEKFAYYLSVNTGTQLTYEAVSQTLGLTFLTIKKYLEAMEKSYFIFTVTPFFTNKNKEIAKQPKIYLADTGIRNMILKTKVIDGKVFENYIASELVRYGFKPKYWRTKGQAEVDFIIENGKEIIPIEVKLSNANITNGLRSFIREYKPKIAFQITLNGEDSEYEYQDCLIKVVTIVKGFEELKSYL